MTGWHIGMFTSWIRLELTVAEMVIKVNHPHSGKTRSLRMVHAVIHRMYKNMLLHKSVWLSVPVLGKKEADIF